MTSTATTDGESARHREDVVNTLAALGAALSTLDRKLDRRLDALDRKIDRRLDRLDERFDALGRRLDALLDRGFGSAGRRPDQQPVADAPRRGSKYSPLADHLRDSGEKLVTMTFDEVERVIGDSIPRTARKEPWWWTGNHRFTQMQAWTAAGYQCEGVDLQKRVVVFRRA